MSLCGEGGAACVGNVRWDCPVRFIITPRTYDSYWGWAILGGGWSRAAQGPHQNPPEPGRGSCQIVDPERVALFRVFLP